MFGDKLKALRENKDLSQKELAAAIGVGTSTITKYERNERQPSFDTLIKIADFFNKPIDYLLDRQTVEPEMVPQIATLIYALNKELQTQRSLPETIAVYKEYKTQIDRLLLDLLSNYLD